MNYLMRLRKYSIYGNRRIVVRCYNLVVAHGMRKELQQASTPDSCLRKESALAGSDRYSPGEARRLALGNRGCAGGASTGGHKPGPRLHTGGTHNT